MTEPVEIFISHNTVERILKTGIQRYRRAHKKGFTFTRIGLPADENPLPAMHEVALTKDLKTLYIQRESVQCLKDTGSVTCRMGEKTLLTFYTEKYVPAPEPDPILVAAPQILNLIGTGEGFGVVGS